jgi:chemotaxis protein methyltransferase WspC
MPQQARTAEQLLRRWIGLDPETIGGTAIDRAVRLRMGAVGASDPDAYLARLAADRDERDRLIDEVVVPESWFFRDAAVFEDLRRSAAARRDAPHLPPLAILSAPCAAGEEPYSVAMALLDAGMPPDRFRIDAFDVSHQSLGRAVAGRYSANAFRAADLGFVDRWFARDGSIAVLDERVKSRVGFAWGNLIDAGFGAGCGPYDVILCRNLLIYLDAGARRSVEMACDRLLAPDGLLVVGAAEPAMLADRWTPAGTASSFVLRRNTARLSSALADPGVPAVPCAAPASAATPPAEPEAPADLAAALRDAEALGAAGRLVEALDSCRRAAAAYPTAPAFFLLAMLEQQAGALEKAEASLHKTLYLDPERADALLELALLADDRGDRALAERYRQSAARVLARKGEA